MSTVTSSRFSQQQQPQQATPHSFQQQRRASIIANGAVAASNATDGLHAILEAIDMHRRTFLDCAEAEYQNGVNDRLVQDVLMEVHDSTHWLAFLAHAETTFQDEEDNMWRSPEVQHSLWLAASRKAFVRPSAPQPRSLPQPHSPQPVGFTSSGAPIYSAIVVPR